jgi:[ribosomal protein S18]-alanine N-acetyltransferase
MTAMVQRPMRWWDIAGVMSIERAVFPTTAWSAAQFWSELAHADRSYRVIESADGIVAYAGAMLRKPTADIQTIAVDTRYRRRGLAQRLLGELLAEADECGCSEVLLEVSADNAGAISLYESEGFEVIARRSSYYAPGHDALIMRRRSP